MDGRRRGVAAVPVGPGVVTGKKEATIEIKKDPSTTANQKLYYERQDVWPSIRIGEQASEYALRSESSKSRAADRTRFRVCSGLPRAAMFRRSSSSSRNRCAAN